MTRDPFDGKLGPPHSSLRKGGKGRTNKSKSSPQLPRTGPGSGARRTATTPGRARQKSHPLLRRQRANLLGFIPGVFNAVLHS
jgi:hypothetical protein